MYYTTLVYVAEERARLMESRLLFSFFQVMQEFTENGFGTLVLDGISSYVVEANRHRLRADAHRLMSVLCREPVRRRLL